MQICFYKLVSYEDPKYRVSCIGSYTEDDKQIE